MTGSGKHSRNSTRASATAKTSKEAGNGSPVSKSSRTRSMCSGELFVFLFWKKKNKEEEEEEEERKKEKGEEEEKREY